MAWRHVYAVISIDSNLSSLKTVIRITRRFPHSISGVQIFFTQSLACCYVQYSWIWFLSSVESKSTAGPSELRVCAVLEKSYYGFVRISSLFLLTIHLNTKNKKIQWHEIALFRRARWVISRNSHFNHLFVFEWWYRRENNIKFTRIHNMFSTFVNRANKVTYEVPLCKMSQSKISYAGHLT